jgi:hypothetical protein
MATSFYPEEVYTFGDYVSFKWLEEMLRQYDNEEPPEAIRIQMDNVETRRRYLIDHGIIQDFDVKMFGADDRKKGKN